jgi:hypothetical protein
MSSLRSLQRALYLSSRAVGDVNAARNGRLPQRLIKRAIHRREIGLLRRWRLW